MRKILLFLFLGFSFQLFSQQEDAWVYFKDKPNSATFLATPLSMLTQRSIDRRARQNIALDVKDVPIETTYYNQIKNTTGITIKAKSKWLNALHVQGTQANINALKNNFSFVKRIEFADNSLNTLGKRLAKSNTITKRNKFAEINTGFIYGNTANQIKMLKGDYLHTQGFTGKKAQIAIIDAGFPNVNTLPAFERIRKNNQILGGYDFVNRSANFYTGHNHGTNVLSTIAGYIDKQFVGSAPDASFYLFITEDNDHETPLEESLWVEAAERADSLGVDVISTSLGYSTFDDSRYNYSYADMDGKTTFISRGAEIGTSRGMLIVVSAGNEGNSSWKYITAPADAASVITVGAVDASGNIASFSSFGPTADNRVKPEILAQGQNVFVLDHVTGNPKTSNGTSFSAPIIAGLIACMNENEGFILKSSKKNTTNNGYFNIMLKEAVYKSADRYQNPLPQYGYGIPNFETALNSYTSSLSVDKQSFINKASIYPNPTTATFTLRINNIDLNSLSIQVFNVLGKKVYEEKSLKSKTIDVSKLNTGIYMLKIMSETQQKTIKLLKK